MEQTHGREFQAMSATAIKTTASKLGRKQPECSGSGSWK